MIRANKILVIVNWVVKYLDKDDDSIQPPDKVIRGKPYWFFKHWPARCRDVDVIDTASLRVIQRFEKNVLKFYIVQALRSFFRSSGYDIILSHGAQSAVSLALLRTTFGRRTPPHIVIDVGCFNGGRENITELYPIKVVSHTFNGIIYHSSVQRAYYSRHFPHLITRYVPFGVDTDLFKPSPDSAQTGNYIVAFGERKRDYLTLCRAWRLLNRGDLELHIIGVESLHDFGVDAVPETVTIHSWMPISALKEMIEHSKFVVLPLPILNYAYGQMSLLQSMSMGKAVIVTRTPATVDYVRDNIDALFVRPYDSEDLSNKMKFLIKNPEVAREIGVNAYNTVRKNFTEQRMALEIHDFCDKIRK